jgi:hypothetical protein
LGLKGQLAAALRGGDAGEPIEAMDLRPVETLPEAVLVRPQAQEQLAGVVALEAEATEDTALVMFQFSHEGAWRPIPKPEARSVTADWDTTRLDDGSYLLRVLVVDDARRTTTSDPVAVSLANVGEAAVPQPPTPSPHPPDPLPDPQPPTPAPEPPPVPEPAPPFPEPQQPPAPELTVAPDPGGFKLWQLERLVAEQPAGDPFVQAEREALVYHLRDFAELDGSIPAQFDWMLYDVLADLLPRD